MLSTIFLSITHNSSISVIQKIEPVDKVKENTSKLLDFISKKYLNEDLDNESLVQIIEHCGAYLNLCTISKYARDNNLSYNGVKKFRNTKILFGVKFVIENE